MKILLVYPGTIVREVPLNLLYISSSLKKAGFDTKIFVITSFYKQKMFRNSNKFIQKKFITILFKKYYNLFQHLLIIYIPCLLQISVLL